MSERQPTELPEVVELQPRLHRDERGALHEVWRADDLAELPGGGRVRQENVSESVRGCLRGLHYQLGRQAKLVRAVTGRVWDVAVDVRAGSNTFGRWVARELDAERRNQLWVPPGFAHGFLVLSSSAVVAYSMTEVYDPAVERGLRWDDPRLGIDWPLGAGETPLLSPKDRDAPGLEAIDAWR